MSALRDLLEIHDEPIKVIQYRGFMTVREAADRFGLTVSELPHAIDAGPEGEWQRCLAPDGMPGYRLRKEKEPVDYDDFNT